MRLLAPDMIALIFIFFFNDTATTEIYTLSLHDALPISFLETRTDNVGERVNGIHSRLNEAMYYWEDYDQEDLRSEEHTSELQSRQYLVCRLLLEKKNVGGRNSSQASSNKHCPPLRASGK